MKRYKIIAGVLLLITIVIGIVSVAKLMSSSKASSSRPDITENMLFSQGKEYIDNASYAEAVVVLTQIEQDSEFYSEANSLLAQAYYSLNYYDKYEETLLLLTTLVEDEQNWIDLVYFYISQSELDKAKDIVTERSKVSDDSEYEYLLGEMSPAAPEFNIPSGAYAEYQLLTIADGFEGATIHYTTGDVEVSVNSDIFTKKVISAPQTYINAISVSSLGYSSEPIRFEYTITKEVEEIPKKLLESRNGKNYIGGEIRNDILGKNWDDDVYNYEMAQITELYFWGRYRCYGADNNYEQIFTSDGYRYNMNNSLSDEYGENSLEILEYMPFLDTLFIGYQKELDIAPISNLQYLTKLSLLNDGITDIHVLSSLTGLETLALGWNEISDVTPLSGLHNLHSLGLWDNNIDNINSLSGLTELTYFDISNNRISNIGVVSYMPNLDEFWCKGNSINDYSALDNCSALMSFYQAGNPVSNYGTISERKNDFVSTDLQ